MFKSLIAISLAMSLSAGVNAGDHSTASVVAAGIGGILLGNHAAKHRQVQMQPVYPVSPNYNAFDQTCRGMVPGRYAGNIGATNAWVRGCSQRMMEDQLRFEQEAYRDGAQ